MIQYLTVHFRIPNSAHVPKPQECFVNEPYSYAPRYHMLVLTAQIDVFKGAFLRRYTCHSLV